MSLVEVRSFLGIRFSFDSPLPDFLASRHGWKYSHSFLEGSLKMNSQKQNVGYDSPLSEIWIEHGLHKNGSKRMKS
ncbi:hypothetical protein [Leptospira stimsonii]|nr:hypothetical protein [Leptospira stimsonii]